MNWDITYDRYDPKSGEKIADGNRLKQIDLTLGDHLDYKEESDSFKEIVWRGQPDPVKLCWNGAHMPVFRVLTNRFKGDGAEDDFTSDWGRFMRDYEREVQYGGRETYFEPDISDIRADDSGRHFTIWVVDKLLKMGEFDQALRTNKVDLPHVKKIDKINFDRLMKAIEDRRDKEKPQPKRETTATVASR